MSIFAPSSNSFRREPEEEKTILVTRKHQINLLAPLYSALGMALIPFLFYLSVKSRAWYPIFSSLFWSLYFLYLLVLWSLVFYNVMIYFLNNVVVTDRRVIENRQKGFFNHETDEVELKNIQDISVKVVGSVAHFLDYGDIELQSAGAARKFVFTKLPEPEAIKETIMQLKMKAN